jgi:SUMO ligase MMS21 Smc5/6 complex component
MKSKPASLHLWSRASTESSSWTSQLLPYKENNNHLKTLSEIINKEIQITFETPDTSDLDNFHKRTEVFTVKTRF